MSPSLRGSGLKCFQSPISSGVIRSPSLRGSGLKLDMLRSAVSSPTVSLFTREWIEIKFRRLVDLPLPGLPLYEGVD